jgi:hypothetical protein
VIELIRGQRFSHRGAVTARQVQTVGAPCSDHGSVRAGYGSVGERWTLRFAKGTRLLVVYFVALTFFVALTRSKNGTSKGREFSLAAPNPDSAQTPITNA